MVLDTGNRTLTSLSSWTPVDKNRFDFTYQGTGLRLHLGQPFGTVRRVAGMSLRSDKTPCSDSGQPAARSSQPG